MLSWFLFVLAPTVVLTIIAVVLWHEPKNKRAKLLQECRIGIAIVCAISIATCAYFDGIQNQKKVAVLQTDLSKAIDKANQLGKLQAWAGKLMFNSQIRLLNLAQASTANEQKLSDLDKSNSELEATIDYDSARFERIFRVMEPGTLPRDVYEGYLRGLDDILKQDGAILLEDMEEAWSTANSLPIGENPLEDVRKQLVTYVSDINKTPTDSTNVLSRLRRYLDLIYAIREATIEIHGRCRTFVFKQQIRMLDEWLDGLKKYEPQMNERLQKYDVDDSAQSIGTKIP